MNCLESDFSLELFVVCLGFAFLCGLVAGAGGVIRLMQWREARALEAEMKRSAKHQSDMRWEDLTP